MKRSADVVHDNDIVESKRLRFDTNQVHGINDNDDDNDDDENDDISIDNDNNDQINNDNNNDDDEMDADEEQEFLKSLNEFATKDINALREFIASAE